MNGKVPFLSNQQFAISLRLVILFFCQRWTIQFEEAFKEEGANCAQRFRSIGLFSFILNGSLARSVPPACAQMLVVEQKVSKA
jgi:hypothetical protein